MVGARVLAEDEDRVGQLEVVQRYRALADADLRRHPRAGWLVAHVRAVGEVVGAELAHEQLVEERGLVAGAPGGRSEEHTSELQSLMRISYAVFCLKKKK